MLLSAGADKRLLASLSAETYMALARDIGWKGMVERREFHAVKAPLSGGQLSELIAIDERFIFLLDKQVQKLSE